MFRSVVGLFVFILSTMGYTLYLQKRNIVVEFIPIIIFGAAIPILFMGGILNILKVTMLGLLGLGLLLLFLHLRKNKAVKSELKELLSPGIIFFLFFCMLFIFNTRSNVFLHYDNFSHWALIVKSLGLSGELPNFNSHVILFTSYPPGSALFVYFFAKVVGFTEANAILGQIVLILACITTLFAWTRKFQDNNLAPSKNKKKQVAILVSILVLSFYLFNGPTFMKDLLVDNLLLLFSVATMNIIFYYFDNLKKALILSLPLMISMLLIKNSGVIFVGLNSLFLLASTWMSAKENRTAITKKSTGLFAMTLLLPWILFYLWLAHVKYVYPAGGSGKHDMSLAYYKKVVSEKSFSDIIQITKAFLLRMFDLRHFAMFYELLGFSLVTLIIALYIKKNAHVSIAKLKFTLLGANIIFLGYMGILWLMYLLSMPLGEALTLASFDRYVGAIFNFLVVIIVVQLILTLAQVKQVRIVTYSCLALTLIFLSVIAFKHQDYQKIFSKQEYPYGKRWKIDQTMLPVENTLLSEDPTHDYVFYMPSSKNDSGYSHYYMQYKLFSERIKIIQDFKTDSKTLDALQNSDYLVVVDQDETITKYIENNHLAHEGKGVYRLN